MSYILEALKKAQAERQLGTTPDIHTAPLPALAPAPARAPRVLAYGVGAALVLAIGAAFWLRASDRAATAPAVAGQRAAAPLANPGSAGQAPGVATGTAGAGRPPAAQLGVASTAGATSATPSAAHQGVGATSATPRPSAAEQRPGAMAAVAGAVAPLQHVAPAPVAGTRSAAALAGAGLQSSGQGASAQPIAAASSARTATGSGAPAGSAPSAYERPNGGAAVTASRQSPPAADPDDALPTLRELPASVRQGLPQPAFGGYIYASNPADRLLLVDKTLRHEGEEVAPGLVLERLHAHYAVLNFHGTRYRVAY